MAPIVWFGDEIVRRVVYWAAFIALVSAPMSWAASYIAPIAQYGWGAVVFAGVGAACVITLVVCGALVTWRYLHPLQKQEDSKTYVGDINVVVGVPPSTDSVLLIGYATRNEARLRIVVEYSYLAVTLGFVGWHARTPVELDDLKDVFTGRKIMIPSATVSPHDKPPKLMWGNHDGPLANSIQKGKYRARIRFVGTDGEQAPAYFLLTALGNGDPTLISVTRHCDFAFISECEK
jgi:hypothetical protein